MVLHVGGLIFSMKSALGVLGMIFFCYEFMVVKLQRQMIDFVFSCVFLRDVAGGAVIVTEAGGFVYDP